MNLYHLPPQLVPCALYTESPVDTVRVSVLAEAASLRYLHVVLEAGVQRLDGVVRDEQPAAVLVVLGHSPRPGLAAVRRLETDLEVGSGRSRR